MPQLGKVNRGTGGKIGNLFPTPPPPGPANSTIKAKARGFQGKEATSCSTVYVYYQGPLHYPGRDTRSSLSLCNSCGAHDMSGVNRFWHAFCLPTVPKCVNLVTLDMSLAKKERGKSLGFRIIRMHKKFPASKISVSVLHFPFALSLGVYPLLLLLLLLLSPFSCRCSQSSTNTQKTRNFCKKNTGDK